MSSSSTRVGIIGGGWPGIAHARGYQSAGGFAVTAVADLIPDRRQKLIQETGKAKEYGDAKELIADKDIDAVSICLPTHLHAPIALAAFKAGKHVMLETPPGSSVKEAKQIAAAASKAGKVLFYGFQEDLAGAELAAKQAIEKGYAGETYHARSTWMRTRGIPIGHRLVHRQSKIGRWRADGSGIAHARHRLAFDGPAEARVCLCDHASSISRFGETGCSIRCGRFRVCIAEI